MSVVETTTDELLFSKSERQLIMGDPGAGKTRYGGTMHNSAYFDLGGGTDTILSPEFIKTYGRIPRHIIQIREAPGPRGVPIEAVGYDETCSTMEKWFAKRLDDFEGIVLDDASAFSMFCENKALEISGTQRGSKSLEKAQSEKRIVIKNKGDWGVEIQMLYKFFETLNRECEIHGKHLIVLCHERKYYTRPKKLGSSGDLDQSAEPVLRMIAPLVAGKDAFAPEHMPSFFSYYWRVRSVSSGTKFQSFFRTVPNSIVSCKTRMGGVFKEEEENISFNYVKNKVAKAKEELAKFVHPQPQLVKA